MSALGSRFLVEGSGHDMGKRREPRKDIRVAVRIFGTDRGGQLFSEKVFTVNVSQHGVELSGVQAQPNVDEIVGITHGVTKAHFRVKWVGQPGSDKAGRLGLLNLSPGKNLWDFPLPPPGYDATVRDARDRRASSRAKCASSVEVYPTGEAAPIRTRTADLSLGGCFLEMPNPLPAGTQIRIALWVKDFKLWANAEVITSTPGFGIGVKFTEMTEQDRNQLKQFIGGMVRIRI
jgi:PilZ domain